MPAAKSSSSARTSSARSKSSPGTRQASRSSGANGIANLVEQLTNRVLKPLDLVMISRDRIQDTLDEAAERGRLTRSDANDLSPSSYGAGASRPTASSATSSGCC